MSHIACFHSTYEELKLISRPFYIWLSNRFHSTYEELKLIMNNGGMVAPSVFILPMRNWNFAPFNPSFILITVFILPMRNWNSSGILAMTSNCSFRFHSTYEELKLTIANIHPQRAISVFILPMRNWNLLQKYLSFSARPMFSFYLWGIETFKIHWHAAFLLRFHSTYEELKLREPAEIEAYRQCFHSTYEELKLILLTIHSRIRYTFSFYLWGIETG